MITLFWLAAFALAWIKWNPKEKKKPPVAVPVTVGDVKRAEKARKEAAKKEQAKRDVERLEAQAKILHDMLVDAQYMADEDGKTPQYYERMQNKIISLQNRLATAENKIEKAKFIVKYGG